MHEHNFQFVPLANLTLWRKVLFYYRPFMLLILTAATFYKYYVKGMPPSTAGVTELFGSYLIFIIALPIFLRLRDVQVGVLRALFCRITSNDVAYLLVISLVFGRQSVTWSLMGFSLYWLGTLFFLTGWLHAHGSFAFDQLFSGIALSWHRIADCSIIACFGYLLLLDLLVVAHFPSIGLYVLKTSVTREIETNIAFDGRVKRSLISVDIVKGTGLFSAFEGPKICLRNITGWALQPGQCFSLGILDLIGKSRELEFVDLRKNVASVARPSGSWWGK